MNRRMVKKAEARSELDEWQRVCERLNGQVGWRTVNRLRPLLLRMAYCIVERNVIAWGAERRRRRHAALILAGVHLATARRSAR